MVVPNDACCICDVPLSPEIPSRQADCGHFCHARCLPEGEPEPDCALCERGRRVQNVEQAVQALSCVLAFIAVVFIVVILLL